MSLLKTLPLFLIPLIIVSLIEIYFIQSNQFSALIYIATISFFLIYSCFFKDKDMRIYWGMMTLPIMLRVMNLGLPFPILDPKLQLGITYLVIIICTFFYAKLEQIKINFGKPQSLFLMALIGILLGLIEYNILGDVPLMPIEGGLDRFYLAGIVFLIGFGEELVYRAVLQARMARVIGQTLALILASLLFGIMHLIWKNPTEFVFTTIAGFIFGYIFNVTKNIWSPIVVHIFNNLVWLGVILV